MGGFENLSLPCVGKEIEPSTVLLVEVAGTQTYQRSVPALLHRAVCSSMSGMLQHLPQWSPIVKSQGKKINLRYPSANICALRSVACGCCPELPEVASGLMVINNGLGKI